MAQANAPAIDILDMNCDAGLTFIQNKCHIDMTQVKRKCAANAIGMFRDLDGLSNEDLSKLGIEIGHKIHIKREIDEAQIARTLALSGANAGAQPPA